MPDRGIASALEGVLQGLVGAQGIKRERSQQLEDQALQQQRLIQQIQLQAALARAAQEAQFAQQNAAREDTQSHQTGERLGTQEFRTRERLGAQGFQSGESAAERALRKLLATQQEQGASGRLAQQLAVQISEGGRDRSAAETRARIAAEGRMGPLMETEDGTVVEITPQGVVPVQGLPKGTGRVGTKRDEKLTAKEKEATEEAAVTRLLGEAAPLHARLAKASGMSLLNYAVSQGLVDREQAMQAVVEEEARLQQGSTDDELAGMFEEIRQLKEQLAQEGS